MHLELTAEQRTFQQSVERFAQEIIAPRAASIDKRGEYPTDVMHAAAGQGLFGVTIPKAWGGGGRDYISYALAIEAVAKASATVAVALSVTNSLVSELIAHAGRDQQREKWLRKLAAGEIIGAFALSEPEAGTDAANQQTSAVREGDGFRIRGRKVWVANAEEAAVAIVFASTRPGQRGQGVTAFLVPMNTPGIARTARADSLGVRGLGCMDLDFDVLVSDDQVLGHIDQGFRLAMWALQGGRVAIAAQALGIGEAALAEALAYAKDRKQFGRPIADYQAIQWMLADSAVEIESAKWIVLHAAWKQDQGMDNRHEASMSKLLGAQMVNRVADRVLQIHGGMGYTKELPIERLYREVRLYRIYEGTDEIQKRSIARNLIEDRVRIGEWE